MYDNAYIKTFSVIEPSAQFKKITLDKMMGRVDSVQNSIGYKKNLKRQDAEEKTKGVGIRVLAVSAVCIVLVAGLLINQLLRIGDQNNLPFLSYDMIDLNSGMGFEGYLAYGADELGLNLIWSYTGETPREMPVFRNRAVKNNLLVFDGGYTEEQLKSFAEEVSHALGVTLTSVEPTMVQFEGFADNGKSQEYFSDVSAKFDGGVMRLTADGSISISFLTPLSVPITCPAANAAQNEQNAYLDELIDCFSETFSFMRSPTGNSQLHYDIYGEARWTYIVYDADGNLPQQLASRCLNPAEIGIGENGEVTNIFLRRQDLSDIVGVYPIISMSQAKEFLLNGEGFSNAPCDFPGEGALVGVDLTYLYDPFFEYYIPFYKFYVELDRGGAGVPTESPENLKSYGVWYVSAIEEQYWQQN